MNLGTFSIYYISESRMSAWTWAGFWKDDPVFRFRTADPGFKVW